MEGGVTGSCLLSGARQMTACQWDQRSYMAAQCEEIARHKWIESERAGRDLGETAARDWVSRYAARFRAEAESSGKYFPH